MITWGCPPPLQQPYETTTVVGQERGSSFGIHQINDHPQYVLGSVGKTMAILTTHLGMVTIPPTKKWCFSWGPGDGDIVLPTV